ncbi:hypothetical protein CCLMGIMDO_CCLMGIMDO_00074 [Companilactobacillus crustorum]|nr:hypothetical protein [Companilactobacillus crustorum]WDT65522.1 hypothetical protein NV391_11250 [Companilactobacillus crustorum]
MSLADNIIKYRQKNQLSQEQLASSLNIAIKMEILQKCVGIYFSLT